jgi:hypothetical protein
MVTRKGNAIGFDLNVVLGVVGALKACMRIGSPSAARRGEAANHGNKNDMTMHERLPPQGTRMGPNACLDAS